MSFVALAALLLIGSVLGWAWRPFWATSGDALGTRIAAAAVAGWVALSGILLGFSLLGIAWHRWSVPPAVMVLIALGWWFGHRRGAVVPAALSPPLGWGDAIATLALLAVVVLAARGQLLFPDFVYHWGIKTQKFALAHGVDWAYLSQPWDANHQRPEYPHLVPSLGALTILVAGRFDAAAVGLWSIAALILVVVAFRGALAAAGVGRATLQAGVAWAGLTLGMFALPYQLAGSADPYMALALMLVLPTLLCSPRLLEPGHDWQLGVGASLAAAAKVEGVALAAVLLVVHLSRRSWAARRLSLGAALRTGTPIALVVGMWVLGCWRISVESQVAGAFDLSRAAVVFGTIWELMESSGWFGMAFLLLLVPVLLLRRELVAVAVAILLQMGFYFYAYLVSPAEPRVLIYTTFARLVLHLMPAVVAALLIASDRFLESGAIELPARRELSGRLVS